MKTMDEDDLNGDAHPDADAMQPGEIEAMIAMVDYLIPQARLVSPSVAMHLLLARNELVISQGLRDKAIVKFSS